MIEVFGEPWKRFQFSIIGGELSFVKLNFSVQ